MLAISMVLLCMVCVVSVLYNYFGKIIESELRDTADVVQQEYERAGNLEGMNFFDTRITLVAPDGDVLYDSEQDESQMENHLNREEISTALEEGEAFVTRHSDTIAANTIYYARATDEVVLRVSKEQNQVAVLLRGMMLPIVGILILTILIALAISRKASKDVVSEIDLSEQQERELLRREFTSNVSHELKTPLTTIYGVSEMLAQGMVKDEDVPRFSRSIRDEADRMKNLIDDIIKLSKLDEAEDMGISSELEEVNVLEEARNVVARLTLKASDAKVTLKVNACEASIMGRRAIVNDIIYNLCDNAIKYNRPGGKVTVGIELMGSDHIRIAVEDTGIGIPAELTDRIFERFYRVDESRGKKVEGTGLGLSIVKHAVKSMGGTMSVKSTENVGTEMIVILPVSSQQMLL